MDGSPWTGSELKHSMSELRQEKDIYLANFTRFEKDLAAHGSPALHRLRKAAIGRFEELGFPTARNEDWKFTSVAQLARVPFQLAAKGHLDGRELFLKLRPDAIRLVFVNGFYAPEHSMTTGLPPRVIVSNLAAALDTYQELIEPHLARTARYEDQPFTALNTAFIRDGAFVYVPKGTLVDKPIHLVFVATSGSEPALACPRNLIVVGESSQATLVENYEGPAQATYFTNTVTEVVAGENAVIDHYKIQREGRDAYHIATTQVQQARSSTFSSHYLGFGGALVRNESRVVLGAEGCECTLNGLYLATSKQHMDNFTVIDHAMPHCASHELYKGILDDKAHGVFNGKIFVRQDAQKTDAKQTNQTLLLSEDATINTKPQLEIYADDVKCTHGATVGQLRADALFYLRSRGIDLEAARSLLIYAFANDIIGRIKVESIRTQLEDALLARQHLPAGQEVKEAL
jgi:Fe-S cluster assembly protein SufD